MRNNIKIITIILLIMVPALIFGCSNKVDQAGDNIKDEYPNKPITLVVPFSAGGTHDVHARLLASVIPKYMNNQTMIVELKPGAGGAIGAKYVAGANPDGYTLLFGGQGPCSVLPLVEDVGYSNEDFIPIARINNTDKMILNVPLNSPFNTLEDLVEYAKKHPDELTYSTSGTWGQTHIPTLAFLYATGIKARHIPYDGGGPQTLAVVSGEVDFSIGSLMNRLPQIEAGNLKTLAVIENERIPELPDVPTAKELGYNVEYIPGYRTIMAPKRTPQDRIDYLREVIRKAVEDESFVKMLNQAGYTVEYLDGPEWQKLWDREIEILKELVKNVEQ
jgi:tripartite-type tricarboxylate transporter receptor subunit TctC